jgi:hypothetical protein
MILAAAAAEVPAGTFTELMDHVAQGFEALAAAILVVGVIWSFVPRSASRGGAVVLSQYMKRTVTAQWPGVACR